MRADFLSYCCIVCLALTCGLPCGKAVFRTQKNKQSHVSRPVSAITALRLAGYYLLEYVSPDQQKYVLYMPSTTGGAEGQKSASNDWQEALAQSLVPAGSGDVKRLSASEKQFWIGLLKNDSTRIDLLAHGFYKHRKFVAEEEKCKKSMGGVAYQKRLAQCQKELVRQIHPEHRLPTYEEVDKQTLPTYAKAMVKRAK